MQISVRHYGLFAEWIEAEVVTSIVVAKVRNFIWKNIITRFDIPRAMISDNARQFDASKLINYLSNLGCQVRFTMIVHLQTNGQAEAANKVILQGLQMKLDNTKGRWVDELHGVLWSLRTEKTATRETPFLLTSGSEAILPVKVALQTHRLATFQETLNDVNLWEALI